MRRTCAGTVPAVGTLVIGTVLLSAAPAQAGHGSGGTRSTVVAAVFSQDVRCSADAEGEPLCVTTTLAAATDSAAPDELIVTLTTFRPDGGRSGLLRIESGSVGGEVALHVSGARRARLAPTRMTLVTCIPESECVPAADNSREVVVSASLRAVGEVRTEVERTQSPAGGCVVRTRSRTTTADAAGILTIGSRTYPQSGTITKTSTRERTRCR